MIQEAGRFCVNIPSAPMLNIVDYCGNTSGADVDKATRCHLDMVRLVEGYPPAVAACRHHLLCAVRAFIRLGSHDVFVADVKHEFVDESCCAEEHEFDYQKLQPLAYCRKEYFTLSDKLGAYGFSTRAGDAEKEGKR